MDSKRAMICRALGTAAAVTLAASTAFVGAAPAGADHPGHSDEDACRSYAEVPNPFVKVEAKDDTFDTSCIKAPAGRDWRIYFMNQDGEAHNISIYSADPAVDKKAKQLYKGKAFKGPQQEEYAIKGLEAGKYFFQDDKVKGMNGVVEVAKAKKAG